MSDKYSRRNEQGKHRLLKDDPAAIRLLKEEHHVFRQLFDRAEQVKGKALQEVANELCLRLAIHMTIEEEILYPACRPVIGDDEVNEGIVEHQSGKLLVAEIEQLDGDEELYKAKIHVLGEETVHHIDEEDEDLFEDAKQAHAKGEFDLDKLGQRLRARQKELYEEVAATGEVGRTCEAEAEEIPVVEQAR